MRELPRLLHVHHTKILHLRATVRWWKSSKIRKSTSYPCTRVTIISLAIHFKMILLQHRVWHRRQRPKRPLWMSISKRMNCDKKCGWKIQSPPKIAQNGDFFSVILTDIIFALITKDKKKLWLKENPASIFPRWFY